MTVYDLYLMTYNSQRVIIKAFDENNYSFIREAFTVACDFNSENLGSDVAEIFMSEDDDYVMVDDDMFYFPDNAF